MKIKLYPMALVLSMLLFSAQVALAFGPHDENCVECHNVHYAKGNFIIGPQPNTMAENPATSAKTEGIESLCLGCHNEAQGIMPIHLTTTHPVGMTPTYVKVPSKLLRDGKLSCVSCHNPHPANANYKYLVVDTNKGAKMGAFCAVCHTEQAPPEAVKVAGASAITSDPGVSPRVQVAAPAAPAPAPAPAAKKSGK